MEAEARNKRLVKIPLPIDLVREMDELLVSGIGGYRGRDEFIADSIKGLILELKYPPLGSVDVPAPEGAATLVQVGMQSPSALAAIEWPVVERPLKSSGVGITDAPLLGLHNRDFPSLWAASQIAEITAKGPEKLDGVLDEVVRRAWTFGSALQAAEKETGMRLTQLFPTNRDKPQSAEAAFLTFAIGRITENATAAGPLFQWNICGTEKRADGMFIGINIDALPLFDQLRGLSPLPPHSQNHAIAFMRYVTQNSQMEKLFFTIVLQTAKKQPDRTELIAKIRSVGDWTYDQASSFAAGYIARSREWGLVEPKLIKGCYTLTPIGQTLLKEVLEK